MIAEFQVLVSRENFFQEFFSPQQGQIRQIMSREEQEIEDIIKQVATAGFLVILQHLEIRASLIIHTDDFAVQNRVKPKFLQGCHHRGKLFVKREPVATGKGDVSPLDRGHSPVSVPFHLKEPVRMVERLLDQGRQHRSQAVRHGC